MAMTEDSVVASLNELRRMANERIRRESEARATVELERRSRDEQQRRSAAHHVSVRPTQVYGAQDQQAHDGGHRAHTPGRPTAGNAWAQQSYPQGYAQPAHVHAVAAPVWEPPPESVRPRRSAAGPVFLTMVLLGAGAGAGYWKLQQDFQVKMTARDSALLQVEEQKNKAVETASKAAQQAKLEIAALEQKLTAALSDRARLEGAAAVVVPGAVAAAKPEPTRQPIKPTKIDRSARSRPAKRVVAVRPDKPERKVEAKAATKSEDKAAAEKAMKVARKKAYGDDPLAGLKL